MKYRKKPVVIEAYQTDKELDIETLEGTMHANVGDYIITGVRGEQYPCKPDIFGQTYEPADAPAASPWHRVEEDLPNEFDTVIVYGRMKYDHEKDYEVFVDAAEYGPDNYSHDRWVTWNDWHEGQEEFKITHWMPLPEPPKEDA